MVISHTTEGKSGDDYEDNLNPGEGVIKRMLTS